MLLKLFGAFDAIIGVILIILGFGIKINHNVLWALAIILFLKSAMGLLKDFASWIDFSCGILILLTLSFNMPFLFFLVLAILIIQKGIFSFL
jgi:hypothetical protein